MRLHVADVLPRALGHVAVHHALEVGGGLEAGAHGEPQLDELAEVLEHVEPAQLLERAHGQGHVVARRQVPERLGGDGALEVQVHLGLGHLQEDVVQVHSKAFLASSTARSKER